MKEIVEGQLKEASEQINKSEEFESTEVITHLEESLQTGEEDIVFAQNKLKSRTTSLCKEGLAFEVGRNFNFSLPCYLILFRKCKFFRLACQF